MYALCAMTRWPSHYTHTDVDRKVSMWMQAREDALAIAMNEKKQEPKKKKSIKAHLGATGWQNYNHYA
jgi:hypothetical protein